MKISTLVSELFSPRIVQAPAVGYIGAIGDFPSLNNAMSALANNGQSVAGGVNYTTSAAAALTLTALGNALITLTNGTAVTLTLDSSYNMVNNLPLPLALGEKFTFQVAALGATTVATPTLSDGATTLVGTTSLVAGSARWYQGVVSQLISTIGQQWTVGTGFVSLAQFGATNNFTVTVNTNTITPTVGNLIFLSGITGTLPAGWYPINFVTSATSFRIAAPLSTVWTATVATVGTSLVAPATYSPLTSVTGLYATATTTVTA